MAVNDLVCKDINAGRLDCSNDVGNDQDGGQQFRKWNKKTNLFYFDVGRESIDDHGHG